MAKLKLLVIEDDADQGDLMRKTLEDSFGPNVSVTTAASSREALGQNLASFDLILTDYNLPDATGLEVLAALAVVAVGVSLLVGATYSHSAG